MVWHLGSPCLPQASSNPTDYHCMRILFLGLVAILASVSACGNSDAVHAGRFAGVYKNGFEVDSFRPCDRDEQWWVFGRTGQEDLHREYAKATNLAVTKQQYVPVYAVVEGSYGPPGRYGHLSAYEREFAVFKVLQVSSDVPGNCRKK